MLVHSSYAGFWDVNYELSVMSPGLVGTVSATFRWNDGMTNRTLTTALVSLLSASGHTSGQFTMHNEGGSPTVEIDFTSLLGDPIVDFRVIWDGVTT